jgi:hypothetical protein
VESEKIQEWIMDNGKCGYPIIIHCQLSIIHFLSRFPLSAFLDHSTYGEFVAQQGGWLRCGSLDSTPQIGLDRIPKISTIRHAESEVYSNSAVVRQKLSRNFEVLPDIMVRRQA